MPRGKGKIVLMGSGELTATMVEVHKEVLQTLAPQPRVVFLDTPAGFQLNVDYLSKRAFEYFRTSIGRHMEVASFKSRDIPPQEAETALGVLRSADYVLVGPGSPTYALRQWRGTPIPDIFERLIARGGCLVAASAAALTVGRFTLPVYEMYKVGEEPHWVEGLDVLGRFGLNMLVVPHWNNAEGGTHDTRFCFIGEGRFMQLEALLPPDVAVLGLDEHTACAMDFGREEVSICGVGTVTVRRGGAERVFRRGERISLAAFIEAEGVAAQAVQPTETSQRLPSPAHSDQGFGDALHMLESRFHDRLLSDPGEAVNTLLGLDRLIWQAREEGESQGSITQARERLQEFIVLLGAHLTGRPGSREECLRPLVEGLLGLRAAFREQRKWQEADAVRDCLNRTGIDVEDTKGGYHWRLRSGGSASSQSPADPAGDAAGE